MKVGVISDTHDNLQDLQAALSALQNEGVTTLLHCGDLCGPDILVALSGFDTWVARGNMDRQPDLVEVADDALGRGRLARFQSITLNGYAVALMHGDDNARLRDTIAAGSYAYVFHGHTHRRRDQRFGRTHVINPGALGGMRWQQRSFCILNLETNEVRFVRV